MAQTAKLGTVATSVEVRGEWTFIRYHDTDVVRFSPDEVILDTGGWFTATTKSRMNQAANQFDLGFRVSQIKGDWLVLRPDGTVAVFDGHIMRFPRRRV